MKTVSVLVVIASAVIAGHTANGKNLFDAFSIQFKFSSLSF